MAKVPRSLTGKVVAITGGARGIGRATAAALIAQGARVAIGDIDAELAARTATELGAGTPGLALDVTDVESFDGFLTAVAQDLGPLDVLVNNAGIMPVGPFVAETEATAQRLIDINVHGVITGSRLALARFLPRGRGHLVNVASIAGKNGFPGGVTYCASKHAVVGLSEAIRAEVRGSGIDVSIVMPTVVKTELGSGLNRTRGLGFAEPEDVADAIVEALQTGRVDVYVPRQLGMLVRSQALVSRRATDLVLRLMKADRVLVSPDHAARAAYEARVGDAVAEPERDRRGVTPGAAGGRQDPRAGPAEWDNRGMSPDQTVVGSTGTLILPTRGPDGPGEALLRMGGGTEAFLAWSEEPLPRGCEVVVWNSRGDRSVDVLQFGSPRTPRPEEVV